MKRQVIFRWVVAILLLPVWILGTPLFYATIGAIMVPLALIALIENTIMYLCGGIDKEEAKDEIGNAAFMLIAPAMMVWRAPYNLIKTGSF